MSGATVPGSPTPNRVLGAFRSWVRGWADDFRQSPDMLPSENGVPDAHSYGSINMLVVDDNPVNLMVISALMAARGIVPLLAEDGAEALALVCEMQFDIVLMDLQMPILDGLDATAAIRRFECSRARPAVPVIAYTASSPGARILAAHGISGSLAKPCEDRDLEDCLCQWCPTYRAAPALGHVVGDDNRFHRANLRSASGTGLWR